MNKKKKSTNTFPYPDEVIDRLARAFYPVILACWNSEAGKENLLHGRRSRLIMPPAKKNRAFPTGNALLYISLSYVDFSECVLFRGAPCFFTMLHHFLRAASGIRHQHGSGSDAAHPGIVPVFCAGTPYKHVRMQCHFPAYCPILSA